MIERASSRNGLGTYLVDPSGRQVLKDKDPRMVDAQIGKSERDIEKIKLIGELRRPLSVVFGKDKFAFQELMRFFG